MLRTFCGDAEDLAKAVLEIVAGKEVIVSCFVDTNQKGLHDRKGKLQRLPLAGVSIGIATTMVRSFAHYGEAVSVATEMKQYAKREPRSSYAVDRRKVD